MQLPQFTTFNPGQTFQPNPEQPLDDIPKRVNLLTSHFENQIGFLRAHYPPDEAAVQVSIRAEQASEDLRILKAHAGPVSAELETHLASLETHFAQYRVVAAPAEVEHTEQKEAKARR